MALYFWRVHCHTELVCAGPSVASSGKAAKPGASTTPTGNFPAQSVTQTREAANSHGPQYFSSKHWALLFFITTMLQFWKFCHHHIPHSLHRRVISPLLQNANESPRLYCGRLPCCILHITHDRCGAINKLQLES